MEMIIRQEETTPIGDYFHDIGIKKIYQKIENTVDEFEVDTSELSDYCDQLIFAVKGLKTKIKSAETACKKTETVSKLKDSFNID